MQHDWLLRENARMAYDDANIMPEDPTFEEAERLRTPAYLEAVDWALQHRASIIAMRDKDLHEQLALI
jgi:hypothetical protein